MVRVWSLFIVSLVLVTLSGCGRQNSEASAEQSEVLRSQPETGGKTIVVLTADAAQEVDAVRPEGCDFLRVSVTKGQEDECAFSYNMGYATEVNPDDHVFESHGVTVVVDRKSALYLDGTTIRFKDGKADGKRGFVFDNPNAVKVGE